jgi:hypothetical protein
LLWGKEQKLISPDQETQTRVVLDKMESSVRNDLNRLDERLTELKTVKGLKIFDINKEMLERCSALSFEKLGLQPFDQAILASILIRAEELTASGEKNLAFCELDSDLQPWQERNNKRMSWLTSTTVHACGFTVISC